MFSELWKYAYHKFGKTNNVQTTAKQLADLLYSHADVATEKKRFGYSHYITLDAEAFSQIVLKFNLSSNENRLENIFSEYQSEFIRLMSPTELGRDFGYIAVYRSAAEALRTLIKMNRLEAESYIEKNYDMVSEFLRKAKWAEDYRYLEFSNSALFLNMPNADGLVDLLEFTEVGERLKKDLKNIPK
jgi:hypothetical protein